jgi:SAM-dependent methyltransferase
VSPETATVTLETRHCALCGQGAPKRQKYAATFSLDDLNAAIFSARRQPDRRHFRLVECGTCGIVYSDPACSAANLAALYSESTVTYDDQEAQIYDSYAPVLDRALGKLRRRGTFVEVGGGRGFMLRYGAEHGFSELIEIEPSADAERRFDAPSDNARFLRSIFVPGALTEGSASLVCFFQMLDHLPNPTEFVQTVYQVLEPGGVAVCVTHDTSALSARVLGEASPIYDIEHTYLFNRTNLARLFERAGFVDTDAFRIANDYALQYWLNMAPLPKALKNPLARAFERTGVGRVRFPVYMGNMGIVARKPDRGTPGSSG